MRVIALLAAFSLAATEATVELPVAVKSFFSTQNAKDCEGWVDLFDENFEVQDPVGSPPVTTKAALLAGCEGNNQLFNTVSLQPTKGEGYAVPGTGGAAVQWRCTSVASVNGSHCPLDFSGVDVFTTSHNGTKITSMHGYFDPSLPTQALAPCLEPTHYGDPFRTQCLKDEKLIGIEDGVTGDEICSAPCSGSGEKCPLDQPSGSTATPGCALVDSSSGDKFCALTCDPNTARGGNPCGPKASCKGLTKGVAANGQAAAGICTYDDAPTK